MLFTIPVVGVIPETLVSSSLDTQPKFEGFSQLLLKAKSHSAQNSDKVFRQFNNFASKQSKITWLSL